MGWTFTEDVEEFAAVAGGFLALRPAENTIELVVTETVRRRGPAAFGDSAPLFGWWRHGGRVESTFLRTPPYPGLLTSAAHEDSVRPLAESLAAAGHPLPGINAAEGPALAFAAAWQQLTGADTEIRLRSRLYRLGHLRPPSPAPPGAARVAMMADSELLAAWLDAFAREAHGNNERPAPGMVADLVSHGGLTLWENDGGPVSLAGVHRPVGGTVRVGPVYTPPEHRRLGYGAAATAAVTQAALDGGATAVVLFTDLANPTSNSIYQRLGYRPVEDRVMVGFKS